MPKNWIWWQKFGSEDATHVNSYYNISHSPEQDTRIFVSSFDGTGPFKREKKQRKRKIGFK